MNTVIGWFLVTRPWSNSNVPWPGYNCAVVARMPNTTARDQCLCLFVFAVWLFKGKSKYMTKHLIDGPLGKLTLASFVFPQLCLMEHQDSWENKTVSLRNIHWVYIINPADKTTLSCYNPYWRRSWIIHHTTDNKVKDLNNTFILQNKKDLNGENLLNDRLFHYIEKSLHTVVIPRAEIFFNIPIAKVIMLWQHCMNSHCLREIQIVTYESM